MLFSVRRSIFSAVAVLLFAASAHAQPAAAPVEATPAAGAAAQATPTVPATPASGGTAKDKHKAALKLDAAGSYQESLVVIEEGLALDAKNVPLLLLKGNVQIKLRDYAGALVTVERALSVGVPARQRAQITKMRKSLADIQTTLIEVTVASGKGSVYLRATDQGVFCVAQPVCSKVLMPGSYPVIVLSEGHEEWTGNVTVVKGQTAKLAVTLVEKPSVLTVRVTPAAATVTVDGAPHPAPAPVPAGAHKVKVSAPGHLPVERDITAAAGKSIDLELSLVAVTPVRIKPAEAAISLDGTPVTLVEGGLVLPPGEHVFVARAPGLGERKVKIPAVRDASYAIEIDLTASTTVAQQGLFTPRRKIALGVGVAGAAAFFGGVALGLSSSSLEDDSYALCPRPESCARADEANDLHDRAADRATYANIAYGVAGAALVGAAVLWFTGAPEKEPRISVTPSFGNNSQAGVDLSVRF